jgi:hypothetical protein
MRNVDHRSGPAQQELLTPHEVSVFLKVGEPTLSDWRYRRKGPPFVKIESLVRYRSADLQDWLERGAMP